MPQTELAKCLRHTHPPMVKMQKRRKELKYSVQSLALLTGISAPTLRKYEKGESIPTFPRLVKIANALECTVNDLVDDTTEGFDAELYNTTPHLDRAYYLQDKEEFGNEDD